MLLFGRSPLPSCENLLKRYFPHTLVYAEAAIAKIHPTEYVVLYNPPMKHLSVLQNSPREPVPVHPADATGEIEIHSARNVFSNTLPKGSGPHQFLVKHTCATPW